MDNTKTIREIATLWKEEKRLYVKQSSFAVYALTIEKHILPRFGDRKSLNESDVQNFVLEKINDGLSKKSVKFILIVLKMILKYGAKHHYLPNIDFSVKFPTEQHMDYIEVLSVDNQRRIMQYVLENFSFRNLGIYISLSTGMRIGEICALKWKDFNIEAETISVTRTIERIYIIEDDKRYTKLVIGTPKTNNSFREIPIDCELLKLISAYATKANQDHFVLTNKTKPTEPRTYRNYYKKLLKQLNIPNLKFHGLRHSFATRCIESQCDYKTVSVILGHANISTTLNLYVHPNMEQKRKCINKMFESLK